MAGPDGRPGSARRNMLSGLRPQLIGHHAAASDRLALGKGAETVAETL